MNTDITKTLLSCIGIDSHGQGPGQRDGVSLARFISLCATLFTGSEVHS